MGTGTQRPEDVCQPLLTQPWAGWGWRSQENTMGLHFPSPALHSRLTFPSGVSFSFGLWTSSGCSSSLMVIP